MARDGAWKIVLGAWLAGAGLTVALHGVEFGPPGAGWWFGLAAGAWEGAAGQIMNRRALQGRDERDVGRALGGGLVRMLVLLVAWWLGRGTLWPEQASAWCMLAMYVVMMMAGMWTVARTLNRMA